jgi:hypothetical protein
MNAIKQLLGGKFNRLTVIEFVGVRNKRAIWKCECDCGKIIEVVGTYLTSNNTKSCGCLNNERISNSNRIHSMSRTPEHYSWSGMQARCYNKNNPKYKDYGGRGIIVCDRWLGRAGFINFYEDLGQRPAKNYTIDRINVNGNYEPSNCRWATPLEQGRNKQSTKYVIYKDERRNLRNVCDQLGLKYRTIISYWRYKKISIQDTFDRYIKPNSTLINHSFGHVN